MNVKKHTWHSKRSCLKVPLSTYRVCHKGHVFQHTFQKHSQPRSRVELFFFFFRTTANVLLEGHSCSSHECHIDPEVQLWSRSKIWIKNIGLTDLWTRGIVEEGVEDESENVWEECMS